MFKNPLKYQSGGVTQSKEQEAENQLVSAIAEGLGAQPEQVKARLEQIKSNPDELKELQSALQLMQQDQNAGFQAVLKLFAKPQSAKHGAKIQDFICKHKRGGYVAGCGCKEDGGIVKGQEGLPSINALRYIEREYDPEGNAVYTMAKTRETLPSNMRNNALSEYSQNGGEYQGNGQIQITDFGNGKTRVNGDPYGAPVEVLLHGNDSTEALNRLRQLAKMANIKLGPAIRENGGKVEKAQWGGITTGNERTNSNNRGQYWEDLTINPEFGRTYRLTVPGDMINGKYISHRSPNGTNVIKSTSVLSSDPSIRWSNVFVPGMKDYSWEDFYFNHMKKNVPQRLSNAQRLVPPIYDVKK